MARLVSRFYGFQGGEIRIDSTDIRELDLEIYRPHLGMVPQDPFLFTGTVRENVRYGRDHGPGSVERRAGRPGRDRARRWGDRPLTSYHTGHMVSHMKTTLNISDAVMRELKREAARSGRTMSELVESALRSLLNRRKDAAEPRELPTFDGGRARVDIANREALYDVMDKGVMDRS